MSRHYKAAGVDIDAGDVASRRAYAHAVATFSARAGRIGAPINVEGGFSGVLDMGPFCLVFNSDGVGTKSLVAWGARRFDTLGWDLVAMVADDAVCLGAEPVAMVNTLDIEKVDATVVDVLMGGLEQAAREAGVAVVGGEIAEMPDAIRGFSWSASLIGVVSREKMLDGRQVQAGHAVVGLHTDNLRANGISLVRRILQERLGERWFDTPFDTDRSWAEAVLQPSRLFTPLINRLLPLVPISAIAHVTGGGLASNTARVIPPGLAVQWRDLPPVPPVMQRLIEWGGVPLDEASRVWNMGVGMVVVTSDPENVMRLAQENGYPCSVVGRIKKVEP